MKDHLKRLTDNTTGELLKASVAREYLQTRILQCLQDDGAFMRWSFLGGTALRFLYSIPRFSEYLDFSVLNPAQDSGFKTALNRIQRTLEAEGYTLGMKVKSEKTVVAAFVRFPGLLYEMGLSPLRSRILSVKIEVDTNPPAGAYTETTLVRRHVILNLHHHDKASLLAGKLHVLMSRPWVKGRDLYDLVWYLSDRSWPQPNLPFLNASLTQTGWTGPEIAAENWREVLKSKLVSIDFDKARSDVLPFLERSRDIELLTQDNVLKVLGDR